MPIYEYECEGCQKVFEVEQRITDSPLENCPTCQGPVQKLISRTSFTLKGSGWYTTDYKRAGRSGSASPSSENKEKSGTSEKSDSSSSSSASDKSKKNDSGSGSSSDSAGSDS